MIMNQSTVQQVYNLKLALGPTPLLSHYLAISTERLRLTISLSLLQGEDAGDDFLITSRENVWDAQSQEELLNLFSTHVPFCHFDLLLLKCCAVEDDMFDRVALEFETTEDLYFIQNAVHFFLRTPSNFTPGLLDLLEHTKSNVAKAYLYPVIALRGHEKSLKVLWSHWLALEERTLPKEDYNLLREGLIIAIGDSYLKVYRKEDFLGSL